MIPALLWQQVTVEPLRAIHWNGEVNLGHIIVALTTFCTVYGAYLGLRSRLFHVEQLLSLHDREIEDLKRWSREQTEILARLVGRCETNHGDPWSGHERRRRPRE